MTTVIPFIYEDTDELFANTYLLKDVQNRCVVIDPGKDYQGLVNYINKNALSLKAILLTHGHADHIRGVDTLVKAFHAPVYIGFDDECMLKDNYLNCGFFLGENITVNSQVNTLADGEVLHLLSEDIIAIHVPYHTAGSMCFYLKDSAFLFTGDFILPHGVGRSDLPNARPKELNKSMMKILELPTQTTVYGGHGVFSTLEIERKVNPFVK